MPIKNSGGTTMRLADLTFGEWFALTGAWWEPGSRVRTAADVRWRSWPEYFETYTAVRAELLAQRSQGWEPFAEVAWPRFQRDRDRFDLAAARAAFHAARDAAATRAARR